MIHFFNLVIYKFGVPVAHSIFMEGGLYKPIDYLLLRTWRGCGVVLNPAGVRVWGGSSGSLQTRQYNNRYKLVRHSTN